MIQPGVTTTTDVEWFIMQRINDMGLMPGSLRTWTCSAEAAARNG